MRVKITNKRLMLAAVGLVGALVVAAPTIAQQNASGQSAATQTVPVTMDLTTLQRTGPGGDLANVHQVTTFGRNIIHGVLNNSA
jgi:hypothetical protein